MNNTKAKKQVEYYWMKVTPDKYQLPEIVTTDIKELARLCHVSPENIRVMIRRYESGKAKVCRYARVEIGEE